MSDEIEVLKLVAHRLEASGFEYMVTGSMALSRYAEPRMTRDIDIVVALEPGDASAIADLFGDLFDCHVDSIERAIRRHGMFNLIHAERIVKVDFIVRKPTPYRREELARRRRLEIDGQPIWVASPEDVLLSKLLWAQVSRSDTQMADVSSLARTAALDWTYIERWATELGIDALLEEIRH